MLRFATLVAVLLWAASACGPDPSAEYRFTGAVTACERLEWASARHDLLQAGDTVEANRYGADRCFVVEPERVVRIDESDGGLPFGTPAWSRVTSVDGAPLEHLASAALREAIGQPPRTTGWVRGSTLDPVR